MTYFSKKEARKKIRAQRNALSDKQRLEYSMAISQIINKSTVYKKSTNIALYCPFDGEIDPTLIINDTNKLRKRHYLPKLPRLKNGALLFGEITTLSKFKENKFGIPEPISGSSRTKKPAQMDLVLTPLVAFDKSGNRLGMGGGFYDKTFSFLKQRQHWLRPQLFGVAYEFQCLEKITTEPWDTPLAGVFTEKGVYYFPN